MNFAGIDLPGWCSFEKQGYLRKWISEHKPPVIVEIGVYGGACLVPMAFEGNMYGAKTVGIDPWSVDPCLEGMVDTPNIEWWQSHSRLGDAHAACKKAIDRLKLKNTELWVGTSNLYRHSFQDNEIGVLSVDGNHGPQAVLDAMHYYPKVAPRGLIAMDDTGWSEGGVFYVQQAIEWLREQGCEFLVNVDGCTMVQKP